MVTLVPSFNPKYYSKPFFWLFTAVIYSQSLNINYNYENISLQSAVYDLIDRYQLLIIFPDELNDEQPISAHVMNVLQMRHYLFYLCKQI
ncbi:MAG: hypothetical protein Ct9H300mP9_7440 [Candidatus Neomarinimicrobiota bacterium]|nr:MAG: hypothetical protein Ct9H300mP9_7440 [Candidatus Neomarinimicrobiota bacterium]